MLHIGFWQSCFLNVARSFKKIENGKARNLDRAGTHRDFLFFCHERIVPRSHDSPVEYRRFPKIGTSLSHQNRTILAEQTIL